MRYYGDESGHFNSLVDGEGEVFAIAVVRGEYDSCRHCSKKAVRDIQSLEEMKWRELTRVPKRRFISCVRDQDIQIGYAAFDRQRLSKVDRVYLLHQSRSHGQIPWDLIAIGCGYAEIIRHLRGEFEMREHFEFDQIYNETQSDIIKDIVQDQVSRVTVEHNLSKSNKGIQVADGIVGAAREDFKSDTDWLSRFDDTRVQDVTDEVLIQLEHWLDESTT